MSTGFVATTKLPRQVSRPHSSIEQGTLSEREGSVLCFATFLVNNHNIANNSTTSDAIEKN
jgi:hypothetical protein